MKAILAWIQAHKVAAIAIGVAAVIAIGSAIALPIALKHRHDFSETAWVQEVPATCTKTGTVGHYHCDCGLDFDTDGNELTDLTIPAKGHTYGAPTYNWDGDSCTATMVCTACTDETGHTVTETVKGEFVEDTPATCTTAQTGHYKATFTNTAFAEQTTAKDSAINCDPNGHVYGDPTYDWDGDSCTATVVCTVCTGGEGHTITETVTASFVEDTVATCTSAQTGHYVATFTNELFAEQTTADDSVTGADALGHEYNYKGQCTRTGCTDSVCIEANLGAQQTVAEPKTYYFHAKLAQAGSYLFNCQYDYMFYTDADGDGEIDIHNDVNTFKVYDKDGKVLSTDFSTAFTVEDNADIYIVATKALPTEKAYIFTLSCKTHDYDYKGVCTVCGKDICKGMIVDAGATTNVGVSSTLDGYAKLTGVKGKTKFFEINDAEMTIKVFSEDGKTEITCNAKGEYNTETGKNYYVQFVNNPSLKILKVYAEHVHIYDVTGKCTVSGCKESALNTVTLDSLKAGKKNDSGVATLNIASDGKIYIKMDKVCAGYFITFDASEFQSFTPEEKAQHRKFVIDTIAIYKDGAFDTDLADYKDFFLNPDFEFYSVECNDAVRAKGVYYFVMTVNTDVYTASTIDLRVESIGLLKHEYNACGQCVHCGDDICNELTATAVYTDGCWQYVYSALDAKTDGSNAYFKFTNVDPGCKYFIKAEYVDPENPSIVLTGDDIPDHTFYFVDAYLHTSAFPEGGQLIDDTTVYVKLATSSENYKLGSVTLYKEITDIPMDDVRELLTGIEEGTPVADLEAFNVTVGGVNCTLDNVIITDGSNHPITSDATTPYYAHFSAGKSYVVTFTFKAQNGYCFNETPTIDDDSVSLLSYSFVNTNKKLSVSFTVNVTGSHNIVHGVCQNCYLDNTTQATVNEDNFIFALDVGDTKWYTAHLNKGTYVISYTNKLTVKQAVIDDADCTGFNFDSATATITVPYEMDVFVEIGCTSNVNVFSWAYFTINCQHVDHTAYGFCPSCNGHIGTKFNACDDAYIDEADFMLGDVRYYSADLVANTTYHLHIDSQLSFGSMITYGVYDPDGTKLTLNTSTGAFKTTKAGTYYFTIENQEKDYSSYSFGIEGKACYPDADGHCVYCGKEITFTDYYACDGEISITVGAHDANYYRFVNLKGNFEYDFNDNSFQDYLVFDKDMNPFDTYGWFHTLVTDEPGDYYFIVYNTTDSSRTAVFGICDADCEANKYGKCRYCGTDVMGYAYLSDTPITKTFNEDETKYFESDLSLTVGKSYEFVASVSTDDASFDVYIYSADGRLLASKVCEGLSNGNITTLHFIPTSDTIYVTIQNVTGGALKINPYICSCVAGAGTDYCTACDQFMGYELTVDVTEYIAVAAENTALAKIVFVPGMRYQVVTDSDITIDGVTYKNGDYIVIDPDDLDGEYYYMTITNDDTADFFANVTFIPTVSNIMYVYKPCAITVPAGESTFASIYLTKGTYAINYSGTYAYSVVDSPELSRNGGKVVIVSDGLLYLEFHNDGENNYSQFVTFVPASVYDDYGTDYMVIEDVTVLPGRGTAIMVTLNKNVVSGQAISVYGADGTVIKSVVTSIYDAVTLAPKLLSYGQKGGKYMLILRGVSKADLIVGENYSDVATLAVDGITTVTHKSTVQFDNIEEYSLTANTVYVFEVNIPEYQDDLVNVIFRKGIYGSYAGVLAVLDSDYNPVNFDGDSIYTSYVGGEYGVAAGKYYVVVVVSEAGNYTIWTQHC